MKLLGKGVLKLVLLYHYFTGKTSAYDLKDNHLVFMALRDLLKLISHILM